MTFSDEELAHLQVPLRGDEADDALAERLGADPVPGDGPFEDDVCGEDVRGAFGFRRPLPSGSPCNNLARSAIIFPWSGAIA